MARFEEITAADPVCDAELFKVFETAEHASSARGRSATPRPVARWEIDQATRRPVCRWVMPG